MCDILRLIFWFKVWGKYLDQIASAQELKLQLGRGIIIVSSLYYYYYYYYSHPMWTFEADRG